MCKNRIRTLLKLLKEENKLIGSPEAKILGAWDDHNFKKLRERLRRHLRKAQHNTCCYCKQRVPFKPSEMAIEHIISKDNNPLFTYHLRNLALICRNCNSTKGAKHTYTSLTVEQSLKRYPTKSTNFLIPHPHYDNYSDHLELKLDFYPVEVAGSKKGKKLIELCDLRRPWRLLENVSLNYEETSTGLEKQIYNLISLECEDDKKILKKVDEILQIAGIV